MNKYINNNYKHLFKIVIIGESGCGKSSLLTQFINSNFDSNQTLTIGVELATKIVKIQNENIKLQLWDTAGQEVFRSITVNYYRGVAGALIVFDVTNKESFNKLSYWIEEFTKLGPENVEIIIVGNKIDLKNRVISYEEAIKFAQNYNVEYIESTSKDYKLCKHVFFRLAQKIKIKYDLLNEIIKPIYSVNTPLLDYDYKKDSCCY